jgi:hypothetical protein
MMTAGWGMVMRLPTIALILTLAAAFGLAACVPDVVSIDAVPPPRFSRDLAQCNAEAAAGIDLGNTVKRCMKARGYRFLKQY